MCRVLINVRIGRKGSILYEEGLLNGFLIVVKDNINVRGFNTSAGTKALKDYKPAVDAPVVEKLKAAGAIVIGIKTIIYYFVPCRCLYNLLHLFVVVRVLQYG